MSDYEGYHVTYDEFEIPVTLHCLKCNAVIARRSEVPSTRDENVVVHAMVKSPNYREVEVELSDGSAMYMPFCSDCIKGAIDPAAALDAVKRGWRQALEHAGRPQAAIDREVAAKETLTAVSVQGVIDARKL